MMKRRKLSRNVQMLFAIGGLFTYGTYFIHSEWPIPDLGRGLLEGMGIGLMITGLVLLGKNGRMCVSETENTVQDEAIGNNP